MPKSSSKQIEQDEEKILSELSRNANKSINDIAKSCGFSRQKVWRVIKDLEKNKTIWGYSAIIDPEKLNKKSYMLIVKRTYKSVEKEILKKAVNEDFINNLKNLGIEVIDSVYTHGFCDWVLYFTTNDLKSAKNFVNYFNKNYEGYISESHLIEIMFPMTKSGITNPELKKFIKLFSIE